MAPNVLTYAQQKTVEEVAGQYGLNPAQMRRIVALINAQAWTVSSMAYFTAYGAAHSVCAKLAITGT